MKAFNNPFVCTAFAFALTGVLFSGFDHLQAKPVREIPCTVEVSNLRAENVRLRKENASLNRDITCIYEETQGRPCQR